MMFTPLAVYIRRRDFALQLVTVLITGVGLGIALALIYFQHVC